MYNNIIKLNIVLLFIMILGCKSEKERWMETKKLDTSDAYIEFIISYPNSTHAKEIYKIIKDDVNKMHKKVWEFKVMKGEDNESEIEELLSRLLEINPKDPLALNNKASIICGEYYPNKNKGKVQKAVDLFEQALEYINRQRVSKTVLVQVIEGQLIEFAQPPNEDGFYPLREQVLNNLEAAHMILDLPFTKPPYPNDLIITGSVFDVNIKPVSRQRFWAVVKDDFTEKNSYKFKYWTDKYGEIASPYADTNDEGRFKFEISYDKYILGDLPTNIFFLTTSSLEWANKSKMFRLMRNKKPVEVKINDDTYSIEIGLAQLENK